MARGRPNPREREPTSLLEPMREMFKLAVLSLLGLGAGVSLVVQATLNASLRTHLASWAWAAFVSYLGGLLTMMMVLLVQREPLSMRAAISASRWFMWTGGLFGAVYIILSIVLLPRLGAAAVVACVVAGQMLASMAFDHFGLFGLAQHSASVPRLLGAVLLIGGVILMRL
jgi:bacterial/archaeal transporter family-2 protein